jgi:shikimate kinase
LFERNVEVLKQNSTVLLLDVPLSTIKNRLHNDKKRPLLQRDDKDRVMEEMYNARLPVYKSVADQIINADKSPLAVAEEIKALLKKQQL